MGRADPWTSMAWGSRTGVPLRLPLLAMYLSLKARAQTPLGAPAFGCVKEGSLPPASRVVDS